jgi:hypothetical protein
VAAAEGGRAAHPRELPRRRRRARAAHNTPAAAAAVVAVAVAAEVPGRGRAGRPGSDRSCVRPAAAAAAGPGAAEWDGAGDVSAVHSAGSSGRRRWRSGGGLARARRRAEGRLQGEALLQHAVQQAGLPSAAAAVAAAATDIVSAMLPAPALVASVRWVAG